MTTRPGAYAVKCKYDPYSAFTFPQVVQPLMPPIFGPGPVIILPAALRGRAVTADRLSVDNGTLRGEAERLSDVRMACAMNARATRWQISAA